MKAIRALKIVLEDTIMSGERAYLEEAIKELEERQKEDEYIYQNMKESLSMGNKAQSLAFVEAYQIINKRLNK